MAVAPRPRGGCPGHVPSMLPAGALAQLQVGTTKGLVMCPTEGLCVSGGEQGGEQSGGCSALPQRLTSVSCPQCHPSANSVPEHPMPFCPSQEDRRADPGAGCQQPARGNAVSREA